jgi:ribosomal protein S18 acetylase RimI-like enzyme
MAIDLRPAEPHEADAIRDIVRAAYAKWVPIIGREPMPMKADYDKAVLDHQFDLAVEAGQIVGLIETEIRDDHLWIENVAVAPTAQGRGIGRLLLACAEHRAIAADRSEIRLVTNAAFEANVSLYARIGYAVDRQEAFMNGVAVYMSKRL